MGLLGDIGGGIQSLLGGLSGGIEKGANFLGLTTVDPQLQALLYERKQREQVLESLKDKLPPEMIDMYRAGMLDPSTLGAMLGYGGNQANYGLTPMYAKDAEGNLTAYQLNNQGGLQPLALPEGMQPFVGFDRAYDEALGRGNAKIQTDPVAAGLSEQQRLAQQLRYKPTIEALSAQGTQRAIQDSARAIEAERGVGKTIGSPELSPAEKQYAAQSRVGAVLDEVESLYQQLDKSGGIVSTDRGMLGNLAARAASSSPGQAIGRAVGSEEQSVRNQINQIRPTLMNEIRQATEMGAKGMDSEKELEFYLQAVSDPTRDLQSNLAALDVLRKAYGVKGSTKASAEAIKKLRDEWMSTGSPTSPSIPDKYRKYLSE